MRNYSVSVVIPYVNNGCEYRQASFEFLRKRWETHYPDWEVVIGECEGEWRKGLAVSNGVDKSSGEIIIMADSDMWIHNIEDSFGLLETNAFFKPYNFLIRLNEETTKKIISGEIDITSTDFESNSGFWDSEELPIKKMSSYEHFGGIFVAHRDSMLDIPGDPRFRGWGGQDASIYFAVETLYGKVSLHNNTLLHLWHPAVPGARQIVYSNEDNVYLRNLYGTYKKSPEDMRKLIEEGKTWRKKIYSVSPVVDKIPKIVHQIWVGDESKKPTEIMDTWKMRGWEYKLWTEKEIDSLGLQNRDLYEFYYKRGLYYGCSDVVRVEVLEKHGGVYIDADSVRMRDIDELLNCSLFAVRENVPGKKERHIVNTVIGSVKNHKIIKTYVEEMGRVESKMPVWNTVGGTLFTKVIEQYLKTNGDSGILLLEPYTFLPFNKLGEKEKEYGKPYAKHFWGSTKSSSYTYDKNNHQEALITQKPKRKTWAQRKMEKQLRRKSTPTL